jgi:hypothetical protein
MQLAAQSYLASHRLKSRSATATAPRSARMYVSGSVSRSRPTAPNLPTRCAPPSNFLITFRGHPGTAEISALRAFRGSAEVIMWSGIASESPSHCDLPAYTELKLPHGSYRRRHPGPVYNRRSLVTRPVESHEETEGVTGGRQPVGLLVLAG